MYQGLKFSDPQFFQRFKANFTSQGTLHTKRQNKVLNRSEKVEGVPCEVKRFLSFSGTFS